MLRELQVLYSVQLHPVFAVFTFGAVVEVTQCALGQRRLELTVDQSTGDGYLVYDPRQQQQSADDAPPGSSLLPDQQLAVRHDSTGIQAGALHSKTTALDSTAAGRTSDNVDAGRLQPLTSPNVGIENCPWTISAKPGRHIQVTGFREASRFAGRFQYVTLHVKY